MIKSELIQRVAAANPHLFQRDVERIINIVLDEITGALINAGASVRSCALVGGHAKRYTVTANARPAPTGR